MKIREFKYIFTRIYCDDVVYKEKTYKPVIYE